MQALAPAGLAIGMVAGEASGDLLAASVIAGLRRRVPAADLYGVGGPAMQAQGFEAWWPAEALAVRGYVEVLRHYPRLVALRAALRRRLLAERPAVFVGIDAPDFNLGLEARLRSAGMRTAHFVSPSIWAWRGGRIEAIRRAVDRMLVVFPFETELYRRAGIDAEFVGHPLADAIPLEADPAGARRALGLAEDATAIAVLPGSRASEVQYNAQAFLEAARWLAARIPNAVFLVPAATERARALLEAPIAAVRAAPGTMPDVRLVEGRSHTVLEAAAGVIVASGTATLETALYRKPMVIGYRMHPISYRIMRRMAYLPWIGLPNILCREFVVPELVQQAATPEAIGQALLEQLQDEGHRARLAERFAALHLELRRDCGERAAEALLALAQGANRNLAGPGAAESPR